MADVPALVVLEIDQVGRAVAPDLVPGLAGVAVQLIAGVAALDDVGAGTTVNDEWDAERIRACARQASSADDVAPAVRADLDQLDVGEADIWVNAGRFPGVQ